MPPPEAELPSKPSRRTRRPPRQSAPSISSHLPQTQDAPLSTDGCPEPQQERPLRILRRGEKDLDTGDSILANLHPPSPHTPPRPRSMYAGSIHKQGNGNDSAPESSNTRKKTSKNQNRKRSGVASPMLLSNGSAASTKNQSLTPVRGNETPARAYAGPTFHASPAASSLPIPKFFSKSVPNVEKTISLKSMMQQEALEAATESDGSPGQENRRPVQDQRILEKSPLDILFRADREAKARGYRPAIGISDNHADQPNASLSPPHPAPRHHSRQPTDGSTSGMFPIEMEGTAADHGPSPGNLERHSINQPHQSHRMTEAERNEEQRKAQTAALKRLIYSPKPQIPKEGLNGERPPSSGLRQEWSISKSPEGSNPPAFPPSPTPSRAHRPFTRSDTQTQSYQASFTGPHSHVAPSTTSSQGTGPAPARRNGDMKSIEDDLRRILKLDVLGEGASSVQS